MKYAHTNLIAEDWKSLSRFYQIVFGCVPQKPQRNLTGEWLDKMTGIPGTHLVGEHLALPGYEGGKPTLEIFSYEGEGRQAATEKLLARPGFAHIAFEVEDVQATAQLVLQNGGRYLGEVVEKHYPELGDATFVYMRDPEGNILELQSWR